MRQLKIVWIYCLWILSASGSSQNMQFLQEVMLEYEHEHAVVLSDEEEFVFDLVGDSLHVTHNNQKQMLILNDFAGAYSRDAIRLSGFTHLQSIDASTSVPSENGYKSYLVSEFAESSDLNGNVFYDDSKLVQFNYPGVVKGAITRLNYSLSYTDFHFLPTIYFQNSVPTLKKVLRVKVRKGISVGHRFVNDTVINTLFRTYKEGKFQVLEWQLKNGEAYNTNVPYTSWLKTVPHLILYVDAINKRSLKDDYYLGSLDELYRYYRQFLKGVEQTPSDNIQNEVRRITKNCKSDFEKARAVLYWVQNNIKYLAYEQGVRGFVPHSGTVVFEKRFGDCKDMSSLICTMLNCVGVKCYFGWIGTRKLPYLLTDFPFINATNHMIAVMPINDRYMVLDGTFSNWRVDYAPYHLQGKEVMIGISDDTYEIYRIPETERSFTSVVDSTWLEISNGVVRGEVQRTYSGYKKRYLTQQIDNRSNKELIESVNRLYRKGNNKQSILSAKVNGLEDREVPTVIEFDFELRNYITEAHDLLYVNLNLDKPLQGDYIDHSKSYIPLDNDYTFSLKYVTKLEIPVGYQVDVIPNKSVYKNDDFGYCIEYWLEDSCVVQQKEFQIDFFHLLEPDAVKWNDMVNEITKCYQNTVVLRKL